MFRALRRRSLGELYDAAAGTWHRGVSKLGYPAAYRQMIAEHPFGADAVADIGAGSGHFAMAWRERAGQPSRLILLDPSGPMLADAGARLAEVGSTAEMVQDGIGSDAIAPGSLDVALCAHVLEHLEAPGEALSWMVSRLRPGGRLYLVASRPHWCTALVRWRWGHRAFVPGDMRRMLAETGFAQVHEVAFRRGPPSRMSRGYVADRPLLEGGGRSA